MKEKDRVKNTARFLMNPVEEMEKIKKEVGYYVVSFYNHKRKKVLYWNGEKWEGFKSDPMVNDEIESSLRLEV